jgi:hypothetical protein
MGVISHRCFFKAVLDRQAKMAGYLHRCTAVAAKKEVACCFPQTLFFT